MAKKTKNHNPSISSESSNNIVTETRSGFYRIITPCDSSSRSQIIFPGKSVIYTGNQIVNISMKFNIKEEARRYKILIKNGVIPSSPESDGFNAIIGTWVGK